MEYKYKGISINYNYYDNKSKVDLVFLHGWGQNIEMMMPIAKPFLKKNNVLLIDLPGFGLSDEPDDIWDIYDYAQMVYSLIKELKIDNPILLGHSFGGKISLCYASKHKTRKLVLFASPFRKSDKKDSLKTKIFKSLRKVKCLQWLVNWAKKHVGSTDYRNATDKMRKILVKHVNLDLTEDVKKITCPTLLIWGTNDSEVNYQDAVMLEKLISNCGLVTYEGCSHYAYLERLSQTINVLNSFLGSEK